MQGLVWGEPELAHEYDFGIKQRKSNEKEVWSMQDTIFLVFSLTVFVGNLVGTHSKHIYCSSVSVAMCVSFSLVYESHWRLFHCIHNTYHSHYLCHALTWIWLYSNSQSYFNTTWTVPWVEGWYHVWVLPALAHAWISLANQHWHISVARWLEIEALEWIETNPAKTL